MTDDRTFEIVERLVRIETLLQSDVKSLDDRVTKLENTNTWLVRTIGAIIITGVIGFIGIK
ncbi:hypothetical protein [Romboutsia ilealis]|uniref:hypothetical protein n=1 Tax=Romboutsia ilealis TaxID=1115758 RepID=UPI0023F2BF9C|nr:hypothetical protein [Romboutsia ilealis]